MSDQNANRTMSPLDFTDMGRSITTLIDGVVQTNLRAAQELLRVDNPEAFMELQQRFVREYMAALMQGTMALVSAMQVGLDASGVTPTRLSPSGYNAVES
jgi:hypothetical protein